jgi:hypothetical protein
LQTKKNVLCSTEWILSMAMMMHRRLSESAVKAQTAEICKENRWQV